MIDEFIRWLRKVYFVTTIVRFEDTAVLIVWNRDEQYMLEVEWNKEEFFCYVYKNTHKHIMRNK